MDPKEAQADADVPKKGPFDQLDRDELIKKCKGLLLIAKNAKQAKDEFAEENAKQKDIIQKLEIQKEADKDNLRTMQEIVDSLTEKKLEAANQICDLEKNLSLVKTQLSNVHEEMNGLKEQTIENESLKRQIKRLTDENEELISEMESLEKNSNNDRLTDIGKYENLKLENEKLLETVKSNEEFLVKFNNLSDHCEKISLELEKTNEIKQRLTSELATFEEQYNVLTQHSRKQADKLKLYKSKIIEFSGKLKQLKLSKEVLAKIVADYSQSVTKWQSDIVEAMKQIRTKSTSGLETIQADDQTEFVDMSRSDVVTSNVVAVQGNEERIALLEQTNNQLSVEIEQVNIQLKDSNDLLFEKSLIEERLKVECTEKENLINELQADQSRLTADNQSLSSEIEKIQEENEAIRQSTLNDFEQERSELIKSSDDLKRTLHLHEQQLNEITNKFADVTGQLENSDLRLSEKQTEVKELKEALSQLQQKRSEENDELLSEMRELNEALKNRGDVISKQKQTIGELNEKIDQLQQQIVQLNLLNDSTNKEIEQMNDRIKEMENRGGLVDDSQMSISTISRAEEVNRMRDIEESFEDKYNKLRLLAVKLKKKVAEQSAIIQTLECKNNQNTNEGQQITSKLGVMEVQVKNLQVLQSENDRLLDELEAARKDGKNNQIELDQIRAKFDKVSSELAELKVGDINASDTKKKVDSSQAIREYMKQIQELKEENAEFLVLKKSMENELIKLKDELNSKDKDLCCQNELVKSLKAEIAKIKTSLKQTNVLNLEMDAYEKSLKETTQKLETKNLQVTELKATIASLETTIEGLKAQIKLLEDNIDSEKQHSIDLKQQINIQHTKIKENHHDISELKIKNDALNKEKNTVMLDLEEFRLDSAKSTIENEKMIQLLQSENEKNIRQLCDLQDEIVQLKSKLVQTEQELLDVHTEFTSYKVRAQSVLRNNQTKETSREKELDEELSTVQVTNDSLNAKITTLVEQNRQIAIDFEATKHDRDHLRDRCKELLQLLDESRQQTEQVQEQYRQESVEHQEALKSQRLQIDTLNVCYKKQIGELEEKYLKEIEDLMTTNNRNRNDGDSTLQSSANVDNRNFSKAMLSDEQQIDWGIMERQAAEGSESTNSNYLAQRKISSNKNRRELIPLDELLNNSFDENSFILDRSVSPTIELETTKAKLTVQESSVKHLTSLLAEAEQDLAKLTQLNDVLKEELRRQERSAEREQHLHNLEYLKNVIFKFLTINCGDEKSHLVPVLNTILKLSPEETHKLERVAKGCDGQRKWGSYLPGWSSNQ